MEEYAAELRLLWALALNGAMLLAGGWFARDRLKSRGADLGVDTLLLWLLGQYAVVGVCGVAGVLSLIPVSVGGAVWAGLLLAGTRGNDAESTGDIEATTRGKTSKGGTKSAPAEKPATTGLLWLAAGAALVAAYVASLAWFTRAAPIFGDDAVAYHVPTAVHWLQQQSISIFPLWLYNPANAYTPLAGSMFAAWQLVLFDHDILVRLQATPFLLLGYFALTSIARRFGLSPMAAACVGIAAGLASPFVGQINSWKDDVIITSMLLAAASALPRWREGEGWTSLAGPLRVGAAIGLMLCVKYTALVNLLVLLPGLRPVRRGDLGPAMRRVGLASAAVALLLAPWLIRNVVLTGNPLFPMHVELGDTVLLSGLLSLSPSDNLAEGSFFRVLISGPFSPRWLLLITIPALWLLTIVFGPRLLLGLVGKNGAAEPSALTSLARIAVLGGPISIALFYFRSPYDEIRFVHGGMAALLICWPIALSALRWNAVLAGVLAFLVALFAMKLELSVQFLASALVVSAAVLYGRHLAQRWMQLSSASRKVLSVAAAFALILLVFVYWSSILVLNKFHATKLWADRYSVGVEGVTLDDFQKPLDVLKEYPNSKLAYANFNRIYLLQHENLRREVIYVPPASDVDAFADLPALQPKQLPGERVIAAVHRVTTQPADKGIWTQRLRERRVQLLFIGKQPIYKQQPLPPIELEWAKSDPAMFRPLIETPAAAVFELRF